MQCKADTCTERQILLKVGTCENCPLYQKPIDSRTCGNDCGERQIISRIGDCSDCHEYMRPDDARKKCISDDCTDT